jgi:hypothetical protein
MAFTRVVKLERPMVVAHGEDEAWRVFDKKRQHEDIAYPNQWVRLNGVPMMLREAMGANMEWWFDASWSQDEGWIFKRRLQTRPTDWYDWQ